MPSSFPVTFAEPVYQINVSNPSSASGIAISAAAQKFDCMGGIPSPQPILALTISGLVFDANGSNVDGILNHPLGERVERWG